MDLIVQTPHLPALGETLQGNRFFTAPGGKGANQAVAVARLGVPTTMIGRVGGDRFGEELLASLVQAGVDTHAVQIDPHTHSGIALITVGDQGENTIIIVPGANGCVDTCELERLPGLFPLASSLLLQLEIPLPLVQAAAQAAQIAGIPVILDPAPAPANLPDSLYPLIDILTPNETEAARLVGFEVSDAAAQRQAAEFFLNRGVKTVVLKLGARGAFCATPTQQGLIPPFRVPVVDTVAAGDAFNGALAAALDQGLSLPEALTWGSAAGAIAVTRPGAQPALPDRPTFEAFLKAHL